MSNIISKIAKGTTLSFGLSILGAGLAYLYRIYLSRILTIEEFGLFYAVFAFIAFFMNFVDLGFSRTLVKFIPQYLTEKKHNLVKATMYFIAAIMLVSTVIFVGLFMISANYLSVHHFQEPHVKMVIILMALSFLFSSGQLFLRQTFLGFQRILLFSTIDVAKTIAIWIFTLVFWGYFGNIYAPALAYSAGFFSVVLVYVLIFWRSVFPNWFSTKWKISKDFAKKIVLFSLPATTTIVGGIFANYIDTILLTYIQGAKEVALYNVAYPTAALLGYFGTSLRYVFFPAAAQLWAENKKQKLVEAMELFNKYVPMLLIPASLFLVEYSATIIELFFKVKFIEATAAMKILLIGNLFLSIALMYNIVLVAIGKPKQDAIVMISSGFLNLILNAILIPKFSTAGAALATSISYFFMFIMSLYYIRKDLHFSFPVWDWIKLVVFGIVFWAIVYYGKELSDLNVFIEIPLIGALALGVYVALLFLFKLLTLDEIRARLKSIHIPKFGGQNGK